MVVYVRNMRNWYLVCGGQVVTGFNSCDGNGVVGMRVYDEFTQEK